MKATFVAVLFLSCLGAYAQQSGPPTAGPLGGAPPLKAINQPNDGARILLMPAVQADLQLTDDQRDKLKALLQKRKDNPVQPTAINVNQQVREILTQDQLVRLEQIRIQIAGYMAVLQPKIAKKLQITDKQAAQILEVIQKARGEQRSEIPKPAHPFLELRAKVDPAILSILTSDQQTGWNQLTGKPFVPAENLK
jgi:Spy/CpxP family protein refolding chaperone